MPFIRAMVALTGLAVGCTGHQPSTPAAAGPTPARCPVTKPDANAPIPPAILADAGTREGLFGNDVAWVALPPDGETRLVPLDGGYARKFMWWRLVEGNLAIDAKRLDAAAPPGRGNVPNGYGPTGFQASGVFFPTTGCWEITGKVADQELRFVVEVTSLT